MGTRHSLRSSSNIAHAVRLLNCTSSSFANHSAGDLQVEGVITRSPSPIPLEERDPDDLSPEEARELVRRLRQQQEQIEIKKEGKKSEHALPLGADSDIEEVSITGEGSARKRKPPSTDSGIEIVDLTDD